MTFKQQHRGEHVKRLPLADTQKCLLYKRICDSILMKDKQKDTRIP